MKKFLVVFLAVFCLSSVSLAADVKVQINGEIVDFKDSAGNTVNAQILNDRTMVPMRKIFEVLGATVDWDGEERIVTGTKGDTIIKLQIDNPVVTKEKSGVEETLTLDVAPTIIEDRTMVPLRFIAESLDKQVGWDSANRTAIIIDYSFFSNELNKNCSNLYQFFNHKKEYAIISLTKNYYDLKSPSENTTMNIKMNATLKENAHDIALTITGNDEIAKEIVSENWNSTFFSLQYDKESAWFNTENAVLKNMLKIKRSALEYPYSNMGLYGNSFASMDDFFRIWAGVADNDLKINTFASLKADFNKVLSMLKNTTTIRYSSYNLDYFDLAKLDNIIVENDFIKAFNFVTKFFFKNDVEKDVVLYDYSKIVLSNSASADSVTFKAELTNDYDEKVEYILELKHN